MKCLKVIPLALALVLAVGTANAASLFTENFDTGTIGALVPTGGSGTVDYSGNSAVFTGAGNDGRAWIGTSDTDYATSSFIAEVQVEVNPGDNNEQSLYLGMGVGTDANNSGAGPGFDEPSVGPTIYAGVRDNGAGNHIRGIFGAGAAGDAIGTNTAGPSGAGVHTLQLLFNGTHAQFAIDLGQTGTFANLGDPINVAGLGFDGTNSRIFIGSSADGAFDDFSIRAIPEPTTIALLGLGALGCLSVRRKRS